MMEKEPIITMVFPANIAAVWGQAEKLLTPAIEIVQTHYPENVRQSLMSGSAQLWVQWFEGNVEAALVTEFKDFPRGLWLNIWLFGAQPEKANEDEFEKHIFKFADENGCVGITDIGRKGWKKRHAHLPIQSENIVYYLRLKDIKEAA